MWNLAQMSRREPQPPPRRKREVILVKDLNDETLEAICNVEPCERSKQLNYLMEDPDS